MLLTSEQTFESAITDSLVKGNWTEGSNKNFDKENALFPENIFSFLQATQPKKWEKLAKIHGLEAEKKVLQRLCKELELRGSIDIVRNGFTDYGVSFDMAYFKPESSLNQTTLNLYDKNILTVTRQVHYSTKNNNSLDLVLSLNGIPLATVELKNQFSGQNVNNAKRQYIYDRDPRELIFQFKKRTIVHFTVDDEEVYMTTKLAKESTYYLPFNKGYKNGKGNPPNAYGYKTDYLWNEVLVKDSWMDILGKFVHLQSEEIEVKATGKKHIKESLIFPRYHQLDVVRKITYDAKVNGAGKDYLIQHSAGSGKSNSIAWLAYRLSSLHNKNDERIFHCVIVVTDRRVLDDQLQKNIYQFEHKTGVVQKIDKDSSQLAEALEAGTNIIITTLQKFPFVIEKIGVLPERKYAVIVDEAHSSQGGEASKKMKEILAVKSLEEAEQEDEAGEEEYDGEDLIRDSMRARGKQVNLSFFAFTATPKAKTLEVFGVPDKEGKPKPFHLYSMRQAIEESFILDVLKSYTTYSLYFKLSKQIEDDPELNKKKAAIAIGRFVSLHPHNIAQKTEVIIEHFKKVVMKQIGGKAKAMVVTSSRLHALRYYQEFKKYILQKGYQDIRPLVAFSGKVIDTAYPDGVSEIELNGFKEKELPDKFDTEEYRILLVANKYQTGFDQPFLHTMYVDKKLNGVLAVQTLSRLNRMAAGKDDTFVLDFVNEREVILASFQPYYEVTTLSETTDPNLLYDLKHKLDGTQIYWKSEIDSLSKVFFDEKASVKNQGQLYALVQPAVDRYKDIAEEKQDEFKRQLTQWIRLYSFLSQIVPFGDVELEKFYAYARLLLSKLPRKDISERLKLNDEVSLQYYRLQKIAEGSIVLEPDGAYELSGSKDTGMKKDKEDMAHLSEIINVLNDRFGTEFWQGDQLFFDQIEAELVADEKLISQAENNGIENFKYGFDERFVEKLIDRMDTNQEIFSKIINEADFGNVVKAYMMKKVFSSIRGDLIKKDF